MSHYVISHELAVGLVTEVVDDETLLDRDFAVELRLSLSAVCHRVTFSLKSSLVTYCFSLPLSLVFNKETSFMKVEIAIIRLLQVPKKLTNRSQLSYMSLQPSTIIQVMLLDTVSL